MSYQFNPFTGSFDQTSSTTPAGTDTQVQFNDGGSFGGDSGLTFNKTTNSLTVGGATVTADAPVLDLSQTWNNAGVTFTGLKFNVTDTASNASSLLMDLTVGGYARFSVSKGGVIDCLGAIISGRLSNNDANFGNGLFYVSTSRNPTLFNGGAYCWSSTSDPIAGTQDLFILRDAANTLAQRNGVNAQTFRLYNTYTDASNYERGFLKWDTNVLKIGTEAAGSGSTRTLEISAGNAKIEVRDSELRFTNNGALNLLFGSGATAFSTRGFTFSSTSSADGASDTAIVREATGALAQRSSTTAQESRVYATYTSGTSYQRCGIKTAKTTLSNVSGASVTASSLIPAGAFLIGVTSRVNTALGTSNGTTGYQVGTASDPDLWGAITGTAEGTASGSANYTAPGASGLFTEATNVIVTAVGGNFNATGVIELAIHYLLTEAD